MKKILVIDDEPGNIKSVRFACELDYEVLSASTGEEAIEIFVKEKPKLVLLDWRLNGKIEGEDVLIFFKEIAPEIPVFVVTASYDSEDRIKELKPDQLLFKPLVDIYEQIVTALPPG